MLLHCRNNYVEGKLPQDYVQDPGLCLFTKYLFFEKDRNRLQA